MDQEERRRVQAIVARVVEDLGLEVLRLTLRGDRFLRLTLDSEEEPITLDHCTRANRSIRRKIEDAGLPADDYHVEVESPGIERPLVTPRHFERFLGERARVELKEPFEGHMAVTGTIAAVEGDRITLERDADSVTFRLDEMAGARLKPSRKP